jgi:hypothetical protein
MRVVAVLVLAAGLGGCGASTAADEPETLPPADTELVVRVWQQGDLRKQPLRWTLTCEPTGGTLPRPARACEQLLALDDPFAPVLPDTACTEIYGGPQVAEVSGKLRGRAVLARFSRSNGCQIDRWERVGLLFAGAAANS